MVSPFHGIAGLGLDNVESNSYLSCQEDNKIDIVVALYFPEGGFKKLKDAVAEDRGISALSSGVSQVASMAYISDISPACSQNSPFIKDAAKTFGITPDMCHKIAEADDECDSIEIMVVSKKLVVFAKDEGTDAHAPAAPANDTETALHPFICDFAASMRQASTVIEKAESVLADEIMV